MRPRTRKVRSFDDTRLACWTFGKGRPLVYLAGGPWAHVELWSAPECRQWYRRLATSHCVVRYDERGSGQSQRDVTDFSLGAHRRDLEAVVDDSALDQFNLFAAANAGPVAIDYAARHPRRVRRLVLWCAWSRTADLHSPRLQAWRTLLDQDWTLMTETCAHLALGWSGGESGRRSAAQLRASIDTSTAKAALIGSGKHDDSDALSRVTAATLVLNRRGIDWLPPALARRLGDALPNARTVLLDGESMAPYLGDTDEVLRLIATFLSEGHAARPPGVSPPKRRSARARAIDSSLTRREREVLGLLSEGETNREIAILLDISVRTVDRHVENLYAKLGARSRVEATAWALTRDIA